MGLNLERPGLSYQHEFLGRLDLRKMTELGKSSMHEVLKLLEHRYGILDTSNWVWYLLGCQ